MDIVGFISLSFRRRVNFEKSGASTFKNAELNRTDLITPALLGPVKLFVGILKQVREIPVRTKLRSTDADTYRQFFSVNNEL